MTLNRSYGKNAQMLCYSFLSGIHDTNYRIRITQDHLFTIQIISYCFKTTIQQVLDALLTNHSMDFRILISFFDEICSVNWWYSADVKLFAITSAETDLLIAGNSISACSHPAELWYGGIQFAITNTVVSVYSKNLHYTYGSGNIIHRLASSPGPFP
jgi:hypothetical protein